MKIYLIGYRCTGKTTIGKKLAACLNVTFLDTDELIQHEAGLNISEIVKQNGWEGFREMEKKTLEKTMDIKSAVISTGGGIVLDIQNRRFMKNNGICVWLKADADIIAERLKNDKKTKEMRPPLSDSGVMKETEKLVQARMPLYQHTHHLIIDTGRNMPDVIVKKISRSIKDVRI